MVDQGFLNAVDALSLHKPARACQNIRIEGSNSINLLMKFSKLHLPFLHSEYYTTLLQHYCNDLTRLRHYEDDTKRNRNNTTTPWLRETKRRAILNGNITISTSFDCQNYVEVRSFHRFLINGIVLEKLTVS